MRTVSELMTLVPLVAPPTLPVGDCALRMDRLGIRHLPLVDAEGRLAGLVTDTAVNRLGAVFGTEYVAYDLRDQDAVAASVAGPVDVRIGPDARIGELMRRMTETQQDFAVVVDPDQHPVGIVTEHDLLKVVVDTVGDEALVEDLPPRLLAALDQDAPGAMALDAMRRLEVRHLVVIDGRGRITGVVSHRDLVADDVLRQPMTVVEVVRAAQPTTIGLGTPLVGCARRMLEDHIGCLPLVADRHPVRMVTRMDLVRAAAAVPEIAGA